MMSTSEVLSFHSEALALSEDDDTRGLMRRAAGLRDSGFGNRITYSRKVFIPLTHLCRDSCRYCTFALPPRYGEQIYMSPEDVLAVARRGEAAGCTEALFTLGDKPELRYRQAREALSALGYETTLDYLRAMAALVVEETSLLPHLNPGVMKAADMAMLRPVAASMGLMLEEVSERLAARGGAHFGSPDKVPPVRLATIAAAGTLNIPFTSGVLVGIGETRRERVETLLALRDLHTLHGHLQEIIIQPFRAKPTTRMAMHPDASTDELLWTIAVARIIFGPDMSIQTPPNLAADVIGEALEAGIDDWGGISPITADYVNPEAPWPHIETLPRACAKPAVCWCSACRSIHATHAISIVGPTPACVGTSSPSPIATSWRVIRLGLPAIPRRRSRLRSHVRASASIWISIGFSVGQ